MQQPSVSLAIFTVLILCVGGAGPRRWQDLRFPNRLVPCSPPEQPGLAAADVLQEGRFLIHCTAHLVALVAGLPLSLDTCACR